MISYILVAPDKVVAIVWVIWHEPAHLEDKYADSNHQDVADRDKQAWPVDHESGEAVRLTELSDLLVQWFNFIWCGLYQSAAFIATI